jgi:hypothetical protein
MKIPYNVVVPTTATDNPIATPKQLTFGRLAGSKHVSLPNVAKIAREARPIVTASRPIFLFEQTLFEKPQSTIRHHAQQVPAGEPDHQKIIGMMR